MEAVTSVLAVLGMMGVDRFRGAGGTQLIKCDWYASIIFGLIMFMLVGADNPLWAAALALAYKAGESLGWGGPLGSYLSGRITDYEEWQVNRLLKKPAIALLVRGFIWGAPISVVLYAMHLDQLAVVALASFTVSFLVAPMIAKRINGFDHWGLQEEIRGGLQMLPLAIWPLF